VIDDEELMYAAAYILVETDLNRYGCNVISTV
jgi:hypothetical protein